MQLDFSRCPRCGAPTKKCTSWNGSESEYWLECTICNTYINTYIPMPHQEGVHRDNHRYIGNFGGYGTGKTTTTREEIFKHMFITPKANVVVGASVSSQYEQTIKRELENDIPTAFVKTYSTQKAYMDLINGARLMWRPYDDQGKLRSLNVSMFVIIEGSETTAEIYGQLKTRLRNMQAARKKLDEFGRVVYATNSNGTRRPLYDRDWRKGIIESNPDPGYVRSDILLVSDKINQYGRVNDTYQQDGSKIDITTSSHIASSEVNTYLPKNFLYEISKNKPKWWVDRYLYGSFQFSEGMVYPNYSKCVVQPYEIPREWKRLIAFDYGLIDAAAFVFCAIDPKRNKLVCYKVAVAYNRDVKSLARIYKDNTKDIPDGGLYTTPIIDPKSGPKRDFNKKTLADQFLDEGILFQGGQVDVNSRVFRLNTYIESGVLEIFETCTFLLEELKGYKFQPLTLDGSKSDKQANKPIDKNNHSINALEWIVMELPPNPAALSNGVFNRFGEYLADLAPLEAKEKDIAPWQFSDDNDIDYGIDDDFNRDIPGMTGLFD